MNVIVIREKEQKTVVGSLLTTEHEEMSLCVYMCVEAGVDPSCCQYAQIEPCMFGAIFVGDAAGLDDDTKSAVDSIDDNDWVDLPSMGWLEASGAEDFALAEISASVKDLF